MTDVDALVERLRDPAWARCELHEAAAAALVALKEEVEELRSRLRREVADTADLKRQLQVARGERAPDLEEQGYADEPALVALHAENRRHKIQIEMQAQTIKATWAERDRLREALAAAADALDEPAGAWSDPFEARDLLRAALKGDRDE